MLARPRLLCDSLSPPDVGGVCGRETLKCRVSRSRTLTFGCRNGYSPAVDTSRAKFGEPIERTKMRGRVETDDTVEGLCAVVSRPSREEGVQVGRSLEEPTRLLLTSPSPLVPQYRLFRT